MKEIISKYLAALVGVFLIVLVLLLTEAGIITITPDKLSSRIIAIFFGIASAQLVDLITRKDQIREIVREEIIRNPIDGCRMRIFDSTDDAYDYIAKKIPTAQKVYNTILSSGAYSSQGLVQPTASAKSFHDAKLKAIKRGKVSWEDIISHNYLEYFEHIKKTINPGKFKYSIFVFKGDMEIFQNYIILDYGANYKEVIFGWIMIYKSITNVQECYVVSNQAIVNHYQKYFESMRDLKSEHLATI